MSKRVATDAAVASAKKLKPAAITSFFKKDGVSQSSTPRAAPAPTTPFDKNDWLSGLDAKQKELLKLEIDTLHDSWLTVLHQELTKPYFLKLKEFVAKERSSHTVFPPEKDVYSWSRHTPFDDVKVVIIGQDPYHNVGQAHGLCFSVQAPCPPPPSLKNIYKALKKDYPTFTIPNHGSLLSWADQGVLLLNTCLTVRAHEANSHQKQGWEQFTQRVIDVVAQSNTIARPDVRKRVVFMAWGKPASERVKKIDASRHLKLESVHPSPLSAARGFFDCRHFIKSNEWITKVHGVENVIDWTNLEPGGVAAAKTTTTTTASKIESNDAQQPGSEATKPGMGNKEESFGISPEEESALLEVAEDPTTTKLQ